jgi:hypothetical protein
MTASRTLQKVFSWRCRSRACGFRRSVIDVSDIAGPVINTLKGHSCILSDIVVILDKDADILVL